MPESERVPLELAARVAPKIPLTSIFWSPAARASDLSCSFFYLVFFYLLFGLDELGRSFRANSVPKFNPESSTHSLIP
jgi:hypothetical protein